MSNLGTVVQACADVDRLSLDKDLIERERDEALSRVEEYQVRVKSERRKQ